MSRPASKAVGCYAGAQIALHRRHLLGHGWRRGRVPAQNQLWRPPSPTPTNSLPRSGARVLYPIAPWRPHPHPGASRSPKPQPSNPRSRGQGQPPAVGLGGEARCWRRLPCALRLSERGSPRRGSLARTAPQRRPVAHGPWGLGADDVGRAPRERAPGRGGAALGREMRDGAQARYQGGQRLAERGLLALLQPGLTRAARHEDRGGPRRDALGAAQLPPVGRALARQARAGASRAGGVVSAALRWGARAAAAPAPGALTRAAPCGWSRRNGARPGRGARGGACWSPASVRAPAAWPSFSRRPRAPGTKVSPRHPPRRSGWLG